LIEVVVGDPVRDADLGALARRLGRTPAARFDPASPEVALLRDPVGLLLRAAVAGGVCEVRAAVLAPRTQVNRRTSLLARAVGGGRGDLVVDATCGLGRDTLELAMLGYRVQAFERHPVLALLLRDALSASDLPVVLHEGDARPALRALPARSVHAVSLDPMFAPRTKSAGVKKEAQVLQRIVGHDDDGADLVAAAWPAAERVVVKRPRHAPPLAEGVSFVVAGRAMRFDVYLTTGRAAPTR
jgi:16S rRNA (guanine1516-N2)-methyltransferase